ncbi:monovalent cation/H(+) antiporter subunit G [Planococcus lenghuensis]|uniref:Na+/H+ antiporter subunit G n=1 Tax=Planococcus lenghuensis TaxID=2213202 RepID=A0A1Q2KWX0_9BACL|nr:monovalent cation/H(+) antiporter subunit G [Planococcus lenghuensis]AQQ52715.1 Na+/H+ antiporter subunit G [Planococcus lenghuensis]
MTETAIVNGLTIIFISLGVIFSLVTALGLIRLPDVYTRSHASSKSATLGVLGILAGTFIYFWLAEGHMNSRLILAIIFLFVTSPLSGHLIGRSAYISGVQPTDLTEHDALKQVIAEKKRKQ